MKVTRLLLLVTAITAAIILANNVAQGDTPRGSWIKREYVDYCETIGMSEHVSPELLEAIIETESSGSAKAYNDTYGCYGLMQINRTAHYQRIKRLGVTDLYDPKQNILVGADYLQELFEKNGDDAMMVLMMYHGESKARQKAAIGEYSRYARKIVTRARELERAHGKVE